MIYVEMSVGNIFWLHALDALRGRSIRKINTAMPYFKLPVILHLQVKSFSNLKVIFLFTLGVIFLESMNYCV